jgi:predicted aconitase with swiveling domain
MQGGSGGRGRERSVYKCRGVAKFFGEGEALVTSQGISFFGGVDPKTGIVREQGHELCGADMTGKVLVFPRGKGSTVGSYVIYQLKKNGHAPAAIINAETETIIAAGCILAEVPLVDKLELGAFGGIRSGDFLMVDGEAGSVTIVRNH